jgi:phosphatidylinositol alpha-1,6-mannosyltransferase
MERLSYDLTTGVSAMRPSHILALRGSRNRMPGFVLASAARVLVGCIRGEIAVLHLGDPVLSPIAFIARAFGVPVAVTLHGLDLTYDSPWYRVWTAPMLRRLDAYVCISRAVQTAAVETRIPAERTLVINPAVDPPPAAAVVRERDLLLYVGRLIPRKGAAWFVEHVLPDLLRARTVRLAIIGTGPDRPRIERIAAEQGIAACLQWLDDVDDEEKQRWYARAALCVLPNIPRAGDFEGFGIVALEAAAAGCPVLAAELEGLRDALADGARGVLIPAADAAAWKSQIDRLLADDIARDRLGQSARLHASHNATRQGAVQAYCALFDRLASQRFST